ncbi:MAG: hypothetical protein ABIG66_04680 [Candidatus Kerfeldbacteria bacterium]
MEQPPQQPDQLSQGSLSRGYWIATHRSQIKMAGTVALAVVAGASVLVFLIITINWLTHIGQTNEIEAGLSQSVISYGQVEKPLNPVVVKSTAVRRDDSSIDIAVHVRNPNETWSATSLDYEILAGGVSAGRETITMAPMQEKYLVRSGVPFTGSSVPTVSAVLQSSSWIKTADLEVLPVDAWEFIQPSFRYIDGTDASVFKSELSFTLRNKSVYGFREPQVVVLMVDDSNNIEAIASVVVDMIGSLETKEMVFRWPMKLERSLSPLIYVNVDKITEERIIR